MSRSLPVSRVLVAALLSVLVGCGDAVPAASQPLAAAGAADARGYDGRPQRLDGGPPAAGDSAEARAVVAEIMRYTGLPQNFDVVEGPVQNAAAVILLGDDRLPRRVIAYNPQFMQQIRRATASNDWVPASIMAHEIGHHLSGHTIVPGGSQPPTELEADKFSGFVLYKMGARLADASLAISTLAPEADGPTHPGRRKRVAAISEGWRQACEQQSGQCMEASTAPQAAPPVTAASSGTPPLRSTPAADTGAASADRGGAMAEAARPREPLPPARVANVTEQLPIPDPQSLPAKFDRFVYDPVGLLPPALKHQLAETLRQHAEQNQIEIVVLVTPSLHGLSADQYAYAMMRQLRVGKLDVGNGAVLVLAPNERSTGVALGAGLYRELSERIDQIKTPMQAFIEHHDACASCRESWADGVQQATDSIWHAARHWSWTIAYPGVTELLAAQAEEERLGADYDPETSKVWRSLLQTDALLISNQGPRENPQPALLDGRVPPGGRALELKTEAGEYLTVYLDAHTETLMPTPLQEGQRFRFVLREHDATALAFDLISFERLQ